MLGENNTNLPRIVSIVAEAFQHEALPITSEVGARLLNIARLVRVTSHLLTVLICANIVATATVNAVSLFNASPFWCHQCSRYRKSVIFALKFDLVCTMCVSGCKSNIWSHFMDNKKCLTWTTTTTTVLWPLYRSTCVGRHCPLSTGGIYWCKVLPPASPCWQQPVHSD